MKRRILFAVGGLVFGVVMGAWGVLASGGGHFILPIMLFISPFWFGLILWPVWGWLAADFRLWVARVLFLITMLSHFAGLAAAIVMEHKSQWFFVGISNSVFLFSIVPYLVAQFFLWSRFVICCREPQSCESAHDLDLNHLV